MRTTDGQTDRLMYQSFTADMVFNYRVLWSIRSHKILGKTWGGGGGNVTLMMASAQVVETSVNINNSPSQDYTTNPDDHSNHNNTQIASEIPVWNVNRVLPFEKISKFLEHCLFCVVLEQTNISSAETKWGL